MVSLLTRSGASAARCHYARECVPPSKPPSDADLIKLVDLLANSSKVLVVTGAGISTESGLPDYRSEGVGAYARDAKFVPVQYRSFIDKPDFRRRYWLKNYLGWNNLSQLRPNAAHLTLTRLERAKKLLHLVTQNVDGLHRKAATNNVVELHGSAHRVRCLDCPFEVDRPRFQETLSRANPPTGHRQFVLNPDGDVDIGEEDCGGFVVPDCPDCGGILKPDIVFFGDSIPRERVQTVNNFVELCDSLVVCGSSLTVQSSYRIATLAHKLGKYIAVVNIGKTRADNLVNLKIEAKCGEVLPAAYNLLQQNGSVKC